MSDQDFIRNVGDRGVRTLDDARRYLLTGPLASYEQYGFGLCAVELKASAVTIGLCGLLRRGLVAITAPGNRASIRILEALGLEYERMVRFGEDGESSLFVLDSARG